MVKKQTLTLKQSYQLLQVSANSSIDEVKRAYRKRAFEIHPDLNPDNAKASKQFQELNEAYVTLIRHLDIQTTKSASFNQPKEATRKEKDAEEQRRKKAAEEQERKEKELLQKEAKAKKEAIIRERIELDKRAQEIRSQREREAAKVAQRKKLLQEAKRQEDARVARREAEEKARKERLILRERTKQEKLQAKIRAEEEVNHTKAYDNSAKPIIGDRTEKHKRTYGKPERTTNLGDEGHQEREQLISDLINDEFARRVYEDIYREVEARDATGVDPESNTESKKRGESLSFSYDNSPQVPQESMGSILKEALAGVPLLNMISKPKEVVGNIGEGVRSWLSSQIDEDQEISFPASKLFPGARIRLQIRTGLNKQLNTVEVTLPSDFLLGKPICLKGMGKHIGKWQGDLYLTFQAK